MNDTKCWSFEKKKKIEKSLATLTDEQVREDTNYQYQERNRRLSLKNLQRPNNKGVLRTLINLTI